MRPPTGPPPGPGPGAGRPVPSPPHLLILGGTTEARRLAEALAARPGGGTRVTTSLAGRVARPVLPPGEVRIGGFGGPEGLADWLRAHRVTALVDATHPFAGTISFNAARAAASAHVPLLALRRPPWTSVDGDDWHGVGSLEEAADALTTLGARRVFLTTGRTDLSAFAGRGDGTWFLVRSVDAPEPPYPARMETLLDRGPFTLDGEREVLRRYAIDAVVTKDSGGEATAPKLTAAREAGLPVVVVRRPAVPEGVAEAATPAEALAWLDVHT
ncbi:cobalt-precorrin-6A reductase [Streptomyces liangshanensis]|uniref:Cobalt-precorrin-6A reductase n=1 Tax=Streptomyces liangshanensis TaxID=2717324 RepID=A0A6G9GZM6_9ACTN|nr:cobalt-precorrin-6A reductase [Streptomyces liangshanensis]QIQ03337.1 cobalt-precorrin-6A reductase [Streptomyces liangshanensis]